MKRIFLSVAMVTLFAAGAFAQGMSGGLKAGLNLATFSGDDADGADMRASFHFGGYLNLGLTEALSFQPELLYNSLGAKQDFDGGELVYKMSYISVPLNLIYSFGNFNVQAGPQFSFLASAKGEYSIGDDSAETDIKEMFKGTDLGVNIGLGASFGKLSASARYFLGLSNVYDSEDDVDLKNSNIQLSLGYRLFGE